MRGKDYISLALVVALAVFVVVWGTSGTVNAPTDTATTSQQATTTDDIPVATTTDDDSTDATTTDDRRPVSYTPEEARDLITIDTPSRAEAISSPLEISGEARGQWFFEADAPVVLVDWDGRIIAEGYITAEGDWMTEEFVPFSGSLEFETPEDTGPQSVRGSLILQRANASGLSENAMAVEIPVQFTQ